MFFGPFRHHRGGETDEVVGDGRPKLVAEIAAHGRERRLLLLRRSGLNLHVEQQRMGRFPRRDPASARGTCKTTTATRRQSGLASAAAAALLDSAFAVGRIGGRVRRICGDEQQQHAPLHSGLRRLLAHPVAAVDEASQTAPART